MKRSVKDWIFVWIPAGFVLGSVILVLLLKWVPVTYSPVMLKRAFQFRAMENYHIEQEWVSLESISPELIEAVIVAEDSRFYAHHGFDWKEIASVLRTHEDGEGTIRGCSTISQQTAKNVFTFGSHTWARKALEAWWTVLIEVIWGKDRILEVYLNVVEMGPGIFGVETASKRYYKMPVEGLRFNEAATLASCLPAPLVSQPGNLSSQARLRKRAICERMKKMSFQTISGR